MCKINCVALSHITLFYHLLLFLITRALVQNKKLFKIALFLKNLVFFCCIHKNFSVFM